MSFFQLKKIKKCQLTEYTDIALSDLVLFFSLLPAIRVQAWTYMGDRILIRPFCGLFFSATFVLLNWRHFHHTCIHIIFGKVMIGLCTEKSKRNSSTENRIEEDQITFELERPGPRFTFYFLFWGATVVLTNAAILSPFKHI